jgi:hypothetical protein
MNRSIIVAALALLGSAPLSVHAGDSLQLAAAPAAPSAAECERSASLTRVQRQLVDRAAQGTRPLAQYIYRTRMIYQLDVMETVAWLDQRRELRQACGERVSQLTPSGD